MNERIRSLVQKGLAGAKECPAKTDIVEELSDNLTEKYNDLVAGGTDPEAAYQAVAEGMGDLGEVVDFINSSPSDASKTGSDPFSELDGILRHMAGELKTPLKEAAGSIKYAFTAPEHTVVFRRMADDLKPSLREAAGSIREAVRSAGKPMRDIADSMRDTAEELRDSVRARTKTKKNGLCSYDFEADPGDIENINIRSYSGDVEFFPSSDGRIHVMEYTDGPLPDDMLASIRVSGGVLQVEQGSRGAAGFVFFRRGVLSSRFELYIPEKRWQSVHVSTSSGDIGAFCVLDTEKLSISSTSGDLDLKAVNCGLAEINTTSGDIFMDGSAEEATVHSISGDVRLTGGTDHYLLRTTSGDISLFPATVPSALNVETVSGDLHLKLLDNDGFTLKYRSVSGDIRSDFPLMTSLNRRNGIAVYGNGELRVYEVRTVSGDMRISKNKASGS